MIKRFLPTLLLLSMLVCCLSGCEDQAGIATDIPASRPMEVLPSQGDEQLAPSPAEDSAVQVGEPDVSDGGQSSEDVITEELPSEPTAVSLREQEFSRVMPFSEGLAWVQYKDENYNTITSVINTNGEEVFTINRKVDHCSPYVDGYAFYLYTIDPSGERSLDNVASCIVDREGNVTYSSENNGVRIILAHGDGHFLAIEHVSNFDVDEWRFGSIDESGNVLVDFDEYDQEPFYFWTSTYDYFIDTTTNSVMDITNNDVFLSRFSYLGEGLFDICSHDGHYAIYDVRGKRVIYMNFFGRPDIADADGFRDGHMILGAHGNSYCISKIDSNGNETSIDIRNPFDMDEVYVSAYSEGVFFYDHAYYDLNLNPVIDLSKYSDKIIGGGPFREGYAPLYIQGADGKGYFTVVDSQGNELFEPTLGYPGETFSEGYLVVATDSGSAVYTPQGEQVLQSPYYMLGSIHEADSLGAWNDSTGTVSKVMDGFFVACKKRGSIPTVFVGLDGSYIGQ